MIINRLITVKHLKQCHFGKIGSWLVTREIMAKVSNNFNKIGYIGINVQYTKILLVSFNDEILGLQ